VWAALAVHYSFARKQALIFRDNARKQALIF
jgi:hypothetical protein